MSEWQPARIAPFRDDGHCNPGGAREAAWKADAGKVVRVRPCNDICNTCGSESVEVLSEDAPQLDANVKDTFICMSQILVD